MTNAPSNIDPANKGTLLGCIRTAFSDLISDMCGAIPVSVVAYTPGAPARVSVRPLIDTLDTLGNRVPSANIENLSVLQYGCGDYFISLPIKTGDKGLIIACDSDISGYLQTDAASAPNTFRKKNFADSYFLPTITVGFTNAPEQADSLVVQNKTATVRVAVRQNSVDITSPTCNIVAPACNITTTEAVINGKLTVNGDTRFNGNQYVDGNIAASGLITPGVPP